MHDDSNALTQAEQIASLPPNLAILKMENDSMTSLAAARPRDPELIKQGLAKTLAAFPQLAEAAIYSKPVGKVVECGCKSCRRRFEAAVKYSDKAKYVCSKCGEDNQNLIEVLTRPRQKFVEGLSIRAAESLRNAFGFNRVRADIIVVTPDLVKIEVTFVDYQTGSMMQYPLMVPKSYKNRYQKMEVIPDDRFWDQTIKGAMSKAIREAVVRSIDPGMRLWFESECDKIRSGQLTDEKINQIVESFATWKLTLAHLEELVGKPRAAWTVEERKRLVGLYTGLKSGELSADELFPEEPTDDKAKAPAGPVNGDSLANGTGTAQDAAPKSNGSGSGSGSGRASGSGKAPAGTLV